MKKGCDKARLTTVVGPKSDTSLQETRSSLGKRSRGCALELDYKACEETRSDSNIWKKKHQVSLFETVDFSEEASNQRF